MKWDKESGYISKSIGVILFTLSNDVHLECVALMTIFTPKGGAILNICYVKFATFEFLKYVLNYISIISFKFH